MANVTFKVQSYYVHAGHTAHKVELYIDGIRFVTDAPSPEVGRALVVQLSRSLGLDKPATVDEAPSLPIACRPCAGTGRAIIKGYPRTYTDCATCKGTGNL